MQQHERTHHALILELNRGRQLSSHQLRCVLAQGNRLGSSGGWEVNEHGIRLGIDHLQQP
jgi:hypothetical protein